jgi:hypothetical protein
MTSLRSLREPRQALSVHGPSRLPIRFTPDRLHAPMASIFVQ